MAIGKNLVYIFLVAATTALIQLTIYMHHAVDTSLPSSVTQTGNYIYYGANESLAKSFNTQAMMFKHSYKGNVHIMKRFPRVLLIGTAKSGTTILMKFLDVHPQVTSHIGESQFFSNTKYAKGFEHYLSLMPYSTKEELTFEKSPQYFNFNRSDIPKRVFSFDPSMKLLLTLKNPINRAISEYHWLNKDSGTSSFENRAIVNGQVNRKSIAVQGSLYSIALQHWLDVFRREQLHIIDGENLITNPWEELQKIERFLGIDSFYENKLFYMDKTKQYYCFKSPEKSECLDDQKGRHHPPIDPKVRRKLQEYYKPYNEKFFDMVGQRFNWAE